jgi:hypothetical protein
MEPKPSSGAISHSAILEFSKVLSNPDIDYRFNKSPPPVPNLNG